MPETQRRRRVVFDVDLRGSRLGPEWLSAQPELMVPESWTDEYIRTLAAEHYGVPLGNVSDPWPKTWEDERR